MSQSSIQIKHSWHSLHGNFTYAIMKPYSASFVDESLPDVEFNIFCDVSNHNSCKVFLSKTPCTPANATVQMLIKYHDEKDEIHEYPWVDDCTFECDFPILDGREKARKHDSPHFISYTFICCITWRGFKEPSQSVDQELYNHLKHSSTLPVFGDTIIVIGKKEIPVHKIILESCSTVFSEMLKAGMTESANQRIVLADVEVDIMEKVVEFLYTKTINPVPEYDVLLSMIKVANKYEMRDLQSLCEKKLSKKITIKNVLEIFEEKSLYGADMLGSVFLFVINNKSSICKLEGFEDFIRNPDRLLEFLIIHLLLN